MADNDILYLEFRNQAYDLSQLFRLQVHRDRRHPHTDCRYLDLNRSGSSKNHPGDRLRTEDQRMYYLLLIDCSISLLI